MMPGDNPFSTPPEERDPVRRFRGRLATPVTLWTSGAPGRASGLTVSSVLVAEGRPASVMGLVGPTTDLWDAIEETGRFVVHVLEERHRHMAERFSGSWPSPGGLFVDLEVEDSTWGPLLADAPNRARCRLSDTREVGYQHLARGVIDALDVGEIPAPLVYFHGRYRRLSSRP